MVYPVFEIGSIETRCGEDIIKFIDEYHLKNNTGLRLVTVTDVTQIEENVTNILNYLNESSRLNEQEYVEKIRNIGAQQQNECWIARTYLFYQLLILTTVLLNTKEEYNKRFSKSIYPLFRQDILDELKNFKMGIFGSITPKSDIDLGIQYSGTMLKTPGLAYIIHAFETLFVLLTGKVNGSLAYDIETYADMLTLTKDNKDYFYLDSSKFTPDDFNNMLPYVGNSIIRSLLLGNNNNIVDFAKFESELNDLFKTTPGLLDIEKNNIISILKSTWDNTNKSIQTFLRDTSYDLQRITYYDKVYIAENEKFALTKNQVDKILDTVTICGLMQKISESLTHRIESYICPPTVVHVVRILQASKNNPTKYETTTPQEFCNNLQSNDITTEPLCSVGKYGFIISMLEQVGNIHRFKLTYCERGVHPDPVKCTEKLDKYSFRYKNAIQWLGKYQQSNGGNPRKSRKNRKKSRKTKRRMNKRKYTR